MIFEIILWITLSFSIVGLTAVIFKAAKEVKKEGKRNGR